MPESPNRTLFLPANHIPHDPLYPFLGPCHPDHPTELGTLGTYRVTKLLGEGGMGFVFRAEDDSLGRRVALKVMKPAEAAKIEARDRFLREGRAVAAVKSDHVITIHSVGEANGVPFLAMELLEGKAVDKWLAGKGGRVAPGDAIRVAKHVLKGLAAAHAKGLVHRDIKPSNLWIDKSTGRVKVLDFGLVRADVAGDKLTRTGAVMGTAEYMAPEQAQARPVDARTDLFSVGVTLYELLTGRSPFARDNWFNTMKAVVDEEPEHVGEVSPELAAFVARLMAKDPARRPVSAAVALAELEAVEKQPDTIPLAKAITPSGSRPIIVQTWSPSVTPVPLANEAPAEFRTVTPRKRGRKTLNPGPAQETRHVPVYAPGVFPSMLVIGGSGCSQPGQ